MIEGLNSILLFLAALAGAWLTFHWQRASVHAKTSWEGLERLHVASAEFAGAVLGTANILSVEARNQWIWEVQRGELRDATRTAETTYLRIVGAVAMYRVAHPQAAQQLGAYASALASVLKETRRIRGFDVHPSHPDRRITLLQRGMTHQGVANRIAVAHRTWATRLGGIVTVATERRLRLFSSKQLALWVPLGVAAVLCISLLYLGIWKAEVQENRVLWINTLTRRVEVTDLPATHTDPSSAPNDDRSAASPIVGQSGGHEAHEMKDGKVWSVLSVALTAVIAVTTICYAVVTAKLLRATRDAFLLNLLLAHDETDPSQRVTTFDAITRRQRLRERLEKNCRKHLDPG